MNRDEDLLFGTTDTQDSIDDLWQEYFDEYQAFETTDSEYESDDDLFSTRLEETTDTGQLLNSPLLASVDAITIPPDGNCMQHVDTNSRMNPGSVSNGQPRDRYWVISSLEAMLEGVVGSLLEGSEKMTFTLKSRARISQRQSSMSAPRTIPTPKVRQISFPGNNAQEAWNFTVLLRIIELVHQGLIDDTIMTKRDIYYRHPDLFVKQAVVDRYVDDLACTLGIPRSHLNVTAAAKGLVAGCLIIHRDDCTRVDYTSEQEGMLVPNLRDTDRLDLTRVHWILVIEKEATFRSLICTPRWSKMRLSGLAAKGYPDLATRAFLRQLTDHAPHCPIYFFVDLDPDGLAIMSTYKYGSYRLAHENVAPEGVQALLLPNTRWLGVQPHHISRLPVGTSGAETYTMPELQGLMRLTARDRAKAVQMLGWDLCSEIGPEQEWRCGLQTMLMLNIKAEMQILDEIPGGLVSFLSTKLGQLQGMDVNLAIEFGCSDDGLLF